MDVKGFVILGPDSGTQSWSKLACFDDSMTESLATQSQVTEILMTESQLGNKMTEHLSGYPYSADSVIGTSASCDQGLGPWLGGVNVKKNCP